MKEYLFDNTVIHTKMYYLLQRGKRQYSEVKPVTTKKKSIFKFEAFMYPPLMLLPETWKRYNYTTEDVICTYDAMDASYVWGISLMLLCGTYEPEAASAGVRSTFQSPFTFLFISRKTVFDVFLSTQHLFLNNSKQSVLCKERPDHKPLLPKIFIDKEEFSTLLQIVPERHPSFMWTPIYPFYYDFKDIKMVPVNFDKGNRLIYMCRIIKKEIYDQIPVQPKKCLITSPINIIVKNQHYILLEEACFFSQSKSIVKKRMNANTIEKLNDTTKKRRQ
jgi:hypothetical protein